MVATTTTTTMNGRGAGLRPRSGLDFLLLQSFTPGTNCGSRNTQSRQGRSDRPGTERSRRRSRPRRRSRMKRRPTWQRQRRRRGRPPTTPPLPLSLAEVWVAVAGRQAAEATAGVGAQYRNAMAVPNVGGLQTGAASVGNRSSSPGRASLRHHRHRRHRRHHRQRQQAARRIWVIRS